MADILMSPFFTTFALPLLTVCVSIFVKTTSRKHYKLTKDDLAVGLDVAVIAIVACAVHSLSIASDLLALEDRNSQEFGSICRKMLTAPWMVGGLGCSLLGMLMFVREWGWASETDLHWLRGIALPLLYGVFVFIIVIRWAGG